MHHNQALALVNQTFTAATSIGGNVPKKLTSERDRLASLSEKVRHFDGGSDLPNAVLTSLEQGRDPATDPDVQTAATRNVLSQSAYGVSAALDQRLTSFLIDHAEELLALFREPFDRAAETLTSARERLGDVPLEDTAAILVQGGDAASVWAQAQAADRAIHQVQQAWKLIGAVASSARCGPRYRLLIIADVPPADFASTRDITRGWDSVRKGLTLSLATPTTLSQRVHAVQHEGERSSLQAMADERADRRRTQGIVVVP